MRNDDRPRGLPVDEENERFEELVRVAQKARLLRHGALAHIVGSDVRVYCIGNRQTNGKRYRYEPGWLATFERDLREGHFLAA